MRCLFVSLLLLTSAALAAPSPDAERGWHRVVGLMQYLEGDYAAAVASHDEAELSEQLALAQEALEAAQALGPEAAFLVPELTAVKALIAKAEDAPGVAARLKALSAQAVETSRLVQAPRGSPDLASAQQVWSAQCGSCHGADGRADGPAAGALKPAPANFHDAQRMDTLTPYKVFNTTTFGVPGTAMAAFPKLTDAERWGLAFLAFTFRQPPCEGKPPKVALQQLATSTDAQLSARYGAEQVACLRRSLPHNDEGKGLLLAKGGVGRAVELFQQGHADLARQAVIDTYLEAFEPIEPMLKARSPELFEQLERAFNRTRSAAQGGDFVGEATALMAALEKAAAEGGAGQGDFWSVFFGAVLILLREGFEALVVVGALLAVLKKMGATEHRRVVHLGWASALVAGALAFGFGHALIASANREWMETLVAFAAVGMLLYAALWLNARANMSRFMGELRSKMNSALGRGSLLGLFTISFTAVARESVETALFLEGLASDSLAGASWGAAAGLLALAALIAFISRMGFVLPMKTLFAASTAMLVATAIMLMGKGVHGLQELGILGLAPVPFVKVAPLGVFPDAWSLLAQAALLGAVLAFRAFKQKRPTAVVSTPARAA